MNTQYIVLLRRKFIPLGANSSELTVGPFEDEQSAITLMNKIMVDWTGFYSSADVIELMSVSEVTGPPVLA